MQFMLIPGFGGSGAPAVLSAAGSEAVLGVMRVRGVQCRAHAEAFTVDKALLETESDYSVN
jgi:hypothetical protein